jgi:hypothetical protein
VAGGLAELFGGVGHVEDVVDDLEDHPEGVAPRRQRLDGRAIEPGDDAGDARRRAVERGRLALDRHEVAVLRPSDVVGVAELLDLAFAQPPDGPGQQPGDLGPERRGDLGGPREQEVAGEDRLQVAPLGVDRLHPAPRVGLVDDVVVVQGAEVHELARHPAAHDVVGRLEAADLGRSDRDDRPQPLATGNDEVGGDLGQVRVATAHRLVDRHLDALTVGAHRRQREQRGPHRGVGHPPHRIRSERPGPTCRELSAYSERSARVARRKLQVPPRGPPDRPGC